MTNTTQNLSTQIKSTPVKYALLPILLLLVLLAVTIIRNGAEAVQSFGPVALLISAGAALLIARLCRTLSTRHLMRGVTTSFKKMLPSLPILLLIGTVSATWMLSGVVPLLITYGLQLLRPEIFLLTACLLSALISVLTGSSWTTIATIGVAFMGIGTAMHFSPAWVAGAVISGAYFGDKVSPLSDTTVLASGSCDVPLFTHIRYMLRTTIPSMLLALLVFTIAGLLMNHADTAEENQLINELVEIFNLSPWLLIVPAGTGVLIAFRCNSYITLGVSTLLGLAAMLIVQPGIIGALSGTEIPAAIDYAQASAKALFTSTQIAAEAPLLADLVGTGGMLGMLPTIMLIMAAMVFGGVMIGTGMLRSITTAIARRISSRRATVATTVASGLMLNGCTGDQYLSIIISSRLFHPMYEQNGLEARLLSRTVEDSVSVTSVLIPWNSCGLAQSSVLGVATIAYLPYCIFNIASPLMSLLFAYLRKARVNKMALERVSS